MTENINTTIRISSTEAVELLRVLADADERTLGGELAWLIKQECVRRGIPVTVPVSQPQP